jgi:pilus assembly protein Flp/PilA
MMKKLIGLVKEEEGQGLTEYGLVLGLIAVAVVGILAAFRTEIIAMFQTALDTVKSRNTTAS